MKAVILAAGKSTRTEPLTLTRPKPLLKAANKELIKHTLDMLIDHIDEAFIIVGYKSEMIKECLTDRYKNIKISYIEQIDQLGTGDALKTVKDKIKQDFILMTCDDFFSKKDIKKLINSKEKYSMLIKQIIDPSQYGIVLIDNDSNLKEIIEKPEKIISNLVNCSCYKLSPEIFNYLDKIKKSSRGEFEFTDAITLVSKDKKVKTIIADSWQTITYPWDLLNLNAKFLENIETNIRGDVETNVMIRGNLICGENTIIKSGTYIEGNVIIGKDCKIGPNAYIRGPTTIGDNCRVGSAEIKASVFFDFVEVSHTSYVGDSIFGKKAHLGSLTSIPNLRHDKKDHKTKIKGNIIDTKRKKLGVILGDNTDTGVNTAFYPARMMWPNTFTTPGQIVKENIEK